MSTLSSLGAWALCTSALKEINEIPSGITSIERYALGYTGIEDLVIPENVDAISSLAFGEHSSLQNLYCRSSVAEQCQTAIDSLNSNVNLVKYTMEDGLYVLTDENNLKNYYSSASDMKNNANICTDINVCKAQVLKNKGYCADDETCAAIVNSDHANTPIEYKNKFYASIDDLLKGKYLPKRIYTIDEAEKVSKKTGNTFKLRYK